ncbi:dynein axonemal assembly factor 5-like [Uloborus diversus]|uniref:dynein axonemal assembly factor 5-like n=1 Tax=Uloborus diversus TaxID=327109 RepID=UPI0024099A32|nr:dynein axonemal assembly factor 5-like [Uloborus diversus]
MMNSKSDNTASDSDQFVQCVSILCEKLVKCKKEDFILKRDTLIEIGTECAKLKTLDLRESKSDIFDLVIKPLLPALCDSSEKCRELASKILIQIFEKCPLLESYLRVIHALVPRLSKSDERESSEEVRLLEIDLLCKIVEKYEGSLLKYFTDITNILCACVIDSFPEVKRRSCECVSVLAKQQQENFHMISSNLLSPLFQTLSHQHFKTRTQCVYAIGSIFCHGSSQDFELALSQLAQRSFDHSPFVRTAVMEVVADWLLMFKDRYSYFHQLIPIMLSTLFDEVEKIRNKAMILWRKAGDQYVSENEKDYKDLIDFPRPDPENYPDPGNRPPVGCRILVQRHFYNILPPLLNDLSDWVVETRVKSSQVLYSLILHAEEKATMQLSSILKGIVFAANDEAKESRNYALRSCELLGFFLEPNLLCDSILTLIHKSPSSIHLSLLAAALRGRKKPLPKDCFNQIIKLLADPAIARVREVREQANLLLCLEGLLGVGNEIVSLNSYQIFTILCTVCGLAQDTSLFIASKNLFKKLADVQNCSLEELFGLHSIQLLEALTSNNELWTSQSPEIFIFGFLIKSDYLNENVMEMVVPVMTNNLDITKDIKLRSLVLTASIHVLRKLTSAKTDHISKKVLDFIQFGIFPNLSWAPGKASTALRTLTVAVLFEIVSKTFITPTMWDAIADELLTLLTALCEDEDKSNRLLACKILDSALPKMRDHIDEHRIHNTCFEFQQCLEDESEEVRIMTTRLLSTYVNSFPKDYHWEAYRAHVRKMYENALIHLDDRNGKVQQSVLKLLKDIAHAAPSVLMEEIESKRYLMAAGDYCDELLKHVQSLNVG